MENDGGNAFPQVESQRVGSGGEYHTEIYSAGGMTLRDYFAAKAVPGLLALCQHDSHEGKSYIEYVAGLSYGMADAMLKARQS